MATEAELRAQIIQSPDDAALFQVYADLLQESGDPRGELVSVQLKLEQQVQNPELKAREARLLTTHARTWLGALAGRGADDLHLSWRRGFLESARLGPPLDQYRTSEIDFGQTLRFLFPLDTAALLRELTIGSLHGDGMPDWQPSIAALAESAIPVTLHTLEFNRGGYWDISMTDLGDLSPAYPKLRHLRALRIEMGALELGTIALPELRSLEIVTGGLRAQNIRSIVNARWPALERLVLYVGDSEGDQVCDVTMEDLAPVLAALNLEHVRHLGLANSSLSDELAVALVKSKILPQLKTLDLSHGTFGAEGAQALLDNAGAFAHLEQIDLTRSFVPDDLVAALGELKPRVILEEQEPSDDDFRYVSISE